ncbi:MAG TPA: DUF2085 domain-containing protein [Polyangiales bacterium]|nr:DUF2085 domain-containing protein [Polyangiales bacterium]
MTARARRRLGQGLRVVLVVIGSAPFWVPLVERAPGLAWLAHAFDAWFSLHCHRDADRSLAIARLVLPVCVRCSGIYVGLGLGALIARPQLSASYTRLWVGLAALIMVLDVLTELLSMRPEWALLRAFTGVLLGYPVGAALVNGALGETSGARP